MAPSGPQRCAVWSLDRRTPVDHLQWRYSSDYGDGERPSKTTRPENTAQRRADRATGGTRRGGRAGAVSGRGQPAWQCPVLAGLAGD